MKNYLQGSPPSLLVSFAPGPRVEGSGFPMNSASFWQFWALFLPQEASGSLRGPPETSGTVQGSGSGAKATLAIRTDVPFPLPASSSSSYPTSDLLALGENGRGRLGINLPVLSCAARRRVACSNPPTPPPVLFGILVVAYASFHRFRLTRCL